MLHPQTCQALHATSTRHPYWVCVARMMQSRIGSYIPLSLPLFCSGLYDIPTDELMGICVSHHRSIKNLASRNPRFYQHRVLDVRHSGNIIATEVLPGGQIALVIFDTKEIQLWDLREEVGVWTRRRWNALRVGKRLASIKFSGTLETYAYQIRTDGDKKDVQVALMSRTQYVR